MTVTIRPMTIEDYDEVLPLWKSSEGVVVSDADFRESIDRYLARNRSLSLVAHDEGLLVATALCGHDGRRGFIYHLAVRKEYRRKGIGRRLVEKCLESLSQENIETSFIFLLDNNREGLAFWEKLHWQKLQWMEHNMIIMGNRMPMQFNAK